MAKSRKFSINRLTRSFTFAGKGVAWVWKSEPNFKAHCLAALTAVILGFFLKISGVEWIAVILSIGIVTCAEAFNSSLEVLADAIHPERHPLIEKAKDASAGAVLLVALAALAVGAIIFLPKVWKLTTTLIPSGG